jgi:riboflavin synthase
VDGVGVVERVVPEGSGLRVGVRLPADLEDFVVMKGSIAVDGVSLTVAGRGPRSFEAALIPETLQVTRLGDYAAGTPVNLEVDIMARYVVEYLRNHAAGGRAAVPVTREHLERHGFGRKDVQR